MELLCLALADETQALRRGWGSRLQAGTFILIAVNYLAEAAEGMKGFFSSSFRPQWPISHPPGGPPSPHLRTSCLWGQLIWPFHP